MSEGSGGLDVLRRRYRQPLYVLFVMAALILAIACANIAGLLTARAATRRREMAIRLSLGAGRGRVISQLLTESVLLSLIGGALSVALSLWGMRFLAAVLANGAGNITLRAELNWQVLAFTTTVSVLVGVVFGLAPAFQATRVDLVSALKGTRSSRAATGPRGSVMPSLGQLFVIGQIALAVVVLVGAGLFVGTLSNLRATELCFNKDGLLLATIEAHRGGYSPAAPDELKAFYGDLQSRLRELPGVNGVSMSWSALAGGGTYVRPVAIPGSDVGAAEVNIQVVGGGFFETMQIPMQSGREISGQDVASRRPVAVIDRRFADAYFPDVDPLGRTIDVEVEGELEIIGVSANARHNVVKGDARPVVYFGYSWDPHALPIMIFELRTEGDPIAYGPAVRRVVRGINSGVVVSSLRTQAVSIDRTINQEIVFAQLCSGFALLALLIACVGLFGIMAHSTTRRVGEIGLRLALGAPRGHVLRSVLAEALGLGAAGIMIGVPAALAASRLIESLLWGIEPSDPATIGFAVGALLLTVVLAGFAPAWRASRIDPMVALRYNDVLGAHGRLSRSPGLIPAAQSDALPLVGVSGPAPIGPA